MAPYTSSSRSSSKSADKSAMPEIEGGATIIFANIVWIGRHRGGPIRITPGVIEHVIAVNRKFPAGPRIEGGDELILPEDAGALVLVYVAQVVPKRPEADRLADAVELGRRGALMSRGSSACVPALLCISPPATLREAVVVRCPLRLVLRRGRADAGPPGRLSAYRFQPARRSAPPAWWSPERWGRRADCE